MIFFEFITSAFVGRVHREVMVLGLHDRSGSEADAILNYIEPQECFHSPELLQQHEKSSAVMLYNWICDILNPSIMSPILRWLTSILRICHCGFYQGTAKEFFRCKTISAVPSVGSRYSCMVSREAVLGWASGADAGGRRILTE